MAIVSPANSRFPRGFSMIELIIVISLLALIVTVSLPSYRHIQASVGLENAAQEVQNALRLAQQMSLSSRNMTGHGVRLGTDDYVSFGGSWDNPAYTVVHALPRGLSFGTGSSSTVLFERHSGETSAATVEIVSGQGDTITISISPTGDIDLN